MQKLTFPDELSHRNKHKSIYSYQKRGGGRKCQEKLLVDKTKTKTKKPPFTTKILPQSQMKIVAKTFAVIIKKKKVKEKRQNTGI